MAGKTPDWRSVRSSWTTSKLQEDIKLVPPPQSPSVAALAADQAAALEPLTDNMLNSSTCMKILFYRDLRYRGTLLLTFGAWEKFSFIFYGNRLAHSSCASNFEVAKGNKFTFN